MFESKCEHLCGGRCECDFDCECVKVCLSVSWDCWYDYAYKNGSV